MPLHS